MWRKIGTLFFLKTYNIFFQNQLSFCFYQKNDTKSQMSLHYDHTLATGSSCSLIGLWDLLVHEKVHLKLNKWHIAMEKLYNKKPLNSETEQN